jgi:serine protease Do
VISVRRNAAVASAVCLLAARAGAITPDAFYAKAAPSVWLVKTFDADGLALGVGSAVVIAPDTLLTNCHVLARAKRVSVRKEKAAHDAKLQYADVERDLCQLSVPGLGAPAVPVGDSDKVTVGQHVYALGNPTGLELTLSDGLVSALRKSDKGNLVLIQTTAPISQGSSGGGLFDENGRLVGITSLLAREGQNLNFAYPINWLKDLPERSAAAMKKRQEEHGRAGAPVPPPPPSGSRPQPSGFAEVGEVDKVPLSPRGKERYAVFLTKVPPRAFAISERGGWSFAWGNQTQEPSASPDPRIRAVQLCEKRTQQRCVLYAVDDVVVYQSQFKPRPAASTDGDEGN